MIPWEHLASASVPDGGGELRLMRRGTELSIMAGAIELMNSRLSGSEEALATLAAAKLKDRPAPQVLIGGLGMGFTLRAALNAFPVRAAITVAELVPEVADWARGPMAGIFRDSLDDPRVSVRVGDVASAIPLGGPVVTPWDAILLDVDNGPEGLTRPANDALYDAAGLRSAHAALTPGGVLAVWSSARFPGFTPKLRRAGFTVEEHAVRASTRGRGARHTVWLANRR